MLIRYIFGPRAGETEHVDRVSAKPLILAQIAEAVDPDDLKDPNDGVVHAGNETYKLPKPGDARVPAPIWSVDFVEVDKVQKVSWLAIRRELHWDVSRKNVDLCFYPPDQVREHKFWKAVPEDVFQEYSRRWKQNPKQRAPVLSPKANFNEQADKALVESAVGAATAAGILDGQRLVGRPGAGLYPERGRIKSTPAANTTERVGGDSTPGEVTWGD